MMIKRSFVLFVVLTTLLISSVAWTDTLVTPNPEHRESSQLITRFISQVHYKKTFLNDAQSKAIFDEYIKTLDPNRSFFTQSDINAFSHYSEKLDNALLQGDLSSVFKMFSAFNQRRIERAKFALKQLEEDFDYSIDEDFQLDREEAPWAKDRSELDELWRKRVKNDVLVLTLSGKTEEEVKKTLRKRYERLERTSHQYYAEDTYEFFINAYLRTIEPHTSYFSPRTSENFKINMSLSLEGIGAVLRSTDEYTEVQRVIKGGPADLSGLLHADDKITGVGQGKDGEIVDVVGWRLDDVVQLIRGPKGSLVRLQIISNKSGVDGPSKVIPIVRDKIKLEEQQAKKSIIELPDGNTNRKVGVISIPTFYMDFDAYQRGDDDYKSTTRDTLALLEELEKENVEGIIIDLRGNGGGSLAEAISLTGLFIKKGPVVQVRESTGNINLNKDKDPSIAYTGPLAVLVDRHSASASEIFAGAIQDYGRGIIVGEPTFGKGTVQSIFDLNRHSRSDNKLGQLKLTVAQFFRVNGDSTQHRGVVPDIVFPTAIANENQGERELDNALPWDKIASAKFNRFNRSGKIDFNKITENHLDRVKTDSGFVFLVAEAQVRANEFDKKVVSLLKSKRKAEREKLEAERLDRLNTYRKSRDLEPIDSIEKLVEEATSNTHDISDDLEKIQLRETAAILLDSIDSSKKKPTLSQR